MDHFIEQIIFNPGKIFRISIFFAFFILFAAIEKYFPRELPESKKPNRMAINLSLALLVVLVSLFLGPGTRVIPDIGDPIPMAKGIGLFISLFLVFSLFGWITHFLMHKIPFLWRIHRVHHMDTFVDVTTTVRFHPLELLVSRITFIPFLIFFAPTAWMLTCCVLLDSLLNLMIHANIKWSRKFEKILALFIVTPGVHRIHHLAGSENYHRNYGTTLSLWDKIFGTYKKFESIPSIPQVYGEPEINSSQRLDRLLLLSFKN